MGYPRMCPRFLFMGPGGFPGMPGFNPVPVAIGRGPVAPPPPPGFGGAGVADQALNKNKRKDPARAVQLTTMGDRLFRVGNLKKAEERYQQAARLDSDSAAPRMRLAQVALVREQYAEAANRIREAETAQPGWIVTAPDIQAIYAEPADFAATWPGSSLTFRCILTTATPGWCWEPSSICRAGPAAPPTFFTA